MNLRDAVQFMVTEILNPLCDADVLDDYLLEVSDGERQTAHARFDEALATLRQYAEEG